MKGVKNLTSLQRRIEREYGKPIQELLREMYVEKGMTMREIAEVLDVNIRTIQRWSKECGIQARKMMWV